MSSEFSHHPTQRQIYLLSCLSEELHELAEAFIGGSSREIIEELADVRAVAELLEIAPPQGTTPELWNTGRIPALLCAKLGRLTGKAIRFGIDGWRRDMATSYRLLESVASGHEGIYLDWQRVAEKAERQSKWATLYERGEVILRSASVAAPTSPGPTNQWHTTWNDGQGGTHRAIM